MGTVSYILCCACANHRVCIVPSIQHYSGRRVLVKDSLCISLVARFYLHLYLTVSLFLGFCSNECAFCS